VQLLQRRLKALRISHVGWQKACNWNTERGTKRTKNEQVGKLWIMFLAKKMKLF
jgi:hypothetical protein